MNRKKIAKGKLVRRFELNIFEQPKYDKLLKKKPNSPGMHGRKRKTKHTEYGKQLIEKQKIKFSYGISERQLINVFKKAKRMGGVTGNNLLSLLERRVDNFIYRAGLATTRSQARQIVSHGHVLLNGRKITIPSILLRSDDLVVVKDNDNTKKMIRSNIEKSSLLRTMPTWVELDPDNLKAKVKHLPSRDEIPTIANEQMLVEWYSKKV